MVNSDTSMYCTAPDLNDEFNQTNGPLRIGLLLDGVTSLLELSNTSLMLYPDPTFETFADEQMFTGGNSIQLEIAGSGFMFTGDQVRVLIAPCKNPDETVCQCSGITVFQLNNVSNSNAMLCIVINYTMITVT